MKPDPLMMTRRQLLKASAGVALGAAFLPRRAHAAEFTFKLATGQDPTHPVNLRAKEAIDRIREATHGRVEINLFPANQLGSDTDLLSQLRSGGVDFFNLSNSILATLVPVVGILNTGFAFPDYDTVWKTVDGELGTFVRGQIARSGILTVSRAWDNGFRHVTTSVKAVKGPEDLRGLKIRVQQSKVFGDTINGLGGNAVPMGWGEVVTAAKSGVIDGGDLPIVNIKALKVYEVSKYTSMTYHNYGPTNVVMNLEIWNGLTAEQKKMLLDLSRETQTRIREATESVDTFAAAKKELEPFGMTVVEAKVEDFRKVAQQKIWPAYKSQYGALWDEIEGFKV